MLLHQRTLNGVRVPAGSTPACAQCGESLLAPEWSEHLDERRMRHLWACESCGYAFETQVRFPARERAA